MEPYPDFSIEFMKAIEQIRIQDQKFHNAKSLWTQAREYINSFTTPMKVATEKLATWFYRDYLQEIPDVKTLADKYYSLSFADPLFRRWKQSQHRANFQIAEDYAFYLRYQEILEKEGSF